MNINALENNDEELSGIVGELSTLYSELVVDDTLATYITFLETMWEESSRLHQVRCNVNELLKYT